MSNIRLNITLILYFLLPAIMLVALNVNATQRFEEYGYNSVGQRYLNQSQQNLPASQQSQYQRNAYQQSAYQNNTYQNPIRQTTENYSTVTNTQSNQLSQNMVRRIMLTTDYISYNPSQTGLFLNQLLGIDASKINVSYLISVANTKNRPEIIREVTWLAQNQENINQGNFNDSRYAVRYNNPSRKLDIAGQKEEGFWGSTSSWVLSGLGVAGAGLAAALAGGGGGGSSGGDGVAPIDLPTPLLSPAVCEPNISANGITQGNPLFDNQICEQCTNANSFDPVCDITTDMVYEQLVDENTTNSASSPLALSLLRSNSNITTSQYQTAAAQCAGESPTCIVCALYPNSLFCRVSEIDFCQGQFQSGFFCDYCNSNQSSWVCEATTLSSSGSGSGGSSGSSSGSTGSGSSTIGVACTENSECQNGLWCNFGMCMRDPSPGDYCQNDSQCSGTGDLTCNGNSCTSTGSSSGSGSGSGSSSGSSSGSGDVSYGRAPIADIADPSTFVTPEFSRIGPNANGRIGLQYALAKGQEGAGVHELAVIDSFPSDPGQVNVDISASRIEAYRTLSGQTFSGNDIGSDSTGAARTVGDGFHGEQVANWAAGERGNSKDWRSVYGQTLSSGSHGSAPGARIHLVQAGSGPSINPGPGINYVLGVPDIKVVNMSFGASAQIGRTYSVASQYQALANAGKLMVVSAGNDGNYHGSCNPAGVCNVDARNPATPATYAQDLNGFMLASVALGSSNTIASYSNWCGRAKEWCIAAPSGVGGPHDAGTSFSAPLTAGAALTVWNAWPFLEANQVSDILRQTATDLGDPGVDDIYGWGLLNLQGAMNPLGGTSTTNSSGELVPFSLNAPTITNSMNTPFGNALNTNTFNNTFTVIDVYGRDFAASGVVTEQQQLVNMAEISDRVGEIDITAAATKKVKFNDFFALRFNELTMNDAAVQNGQFQFFGDFTPHEKVNLSLGFTNEVRRIYTGDQNAFNMNNFISAQDFEVPYLQFMQFTPAVATELGVKITDQVSTRLTGLFSYESQQQQQNINLSQGVNNGLVGFASSIFELKYSPFEKASFNFKNGMVLEYDTLFGTQSTGLLDLSDDTQTMFAGLDIDYDFADNWNFFATGYIGSTQVTPGASSAFTEISDIVTDSYTVALTRKEIFGDDSLTLSLSQPLRVISGQLNGSTLGVNPVTGEISQANFAQTLVPTGRTLRAQLAYEKDVDDETRVFVSGSAEDQPLHSRNRDNIYTIFGKVKYLLN